MVAALAAQPEIELGVHLHVKRSEAPSRIRAAFQAGCRRFDAALGGFGGCPFAQDTLVGNIPTEILLQEIARLWRHGPAALATWRFDPHECGDRVGWGLP